MNRRKFIKGCLYCASVPILATAGISICNLYKKNKVLNENLNPYEELDIGIVEHCNLKCKYCDHLANIAEYGIYELSEFEKDIRQLAKIAGNNIKSIDLLGGEPLLHPQVNEICKITRTYFPKAHIYLTTNCVLLDKMNNIFWQNIKDNNIHLSMSLYNVPINWKSILNKIKKYKIIATITNNSLEPTIENIQNNITKTFGKFYFDINGKQDIKNSFGSCNSNTLILKNGKIFHCAYASNIDIFNKKFKTNMQIKNEDFIDIYKMKNYKECVAFVENPSQFCRYCKGCIESKPWENSKIHTIEEWT